MLTTSQSNSSP